MTESVDEAAFLAPVSEEAPCGPDLDAEGDAEFLNFMARVEGQLPAAFFDFDPKSIDFADALATGAKLLARSHDLRLLVLFAKLSILGRDLEKFAHWLAVMARLLADSWEDVHPRGEDGDFSGRIAQLFTLDDGPVVVLPMQYAPLAETQRDGTLTFRAQLVALGEAKARESKELPSGGVRESERLPNAATIDRILLGADLDALSRTLHSLRRIKASIAQIRTISIERCGGEHALNFGALSPLVERMADFIQAAIARRDPAMPAPAPAEAGPSAPQAAPQFASLAEVDAALGAALAYFELTEPSSPAGLLIGQSRQLLGKNLYVVMKLLAPSHADGARIFVGGDAAFTVPVSSIPASEAAAAPPEKQASPPAASRAAALALIDGVAAHMRKVEPSSPAPYLLDRAKTLASRDFLSLLKDLLSEDALSSMKSGR